MKSKSRHRVWFSTAVACLLVATSPTAHGQAFYSAFKSQIFFQNSSSGPVADPNQPFNFSAQAAVSATLTFPSGSTQAMPFVSNDGSFEINAAFATKAALDAAFPNGTYRMTGTGIPTLTLNLTTELYPTVTPQVTNGTWNSGGLLVVDPTQTTTINFSTFTGYATSGVAGHMQIKIQGQSDNVRLQNEILSAANPFGLPVQSTPLTSITIPAGTLTSGRVYQGQADYDTAATFDLTSVSGGGVVAIFQKVLSFYVAAQAAGTSTPPPVITAQPPNQTGIAGGSVTFNVGFTVGGSNQVNNFISNWYFNGRQLNNLDGTKYANSTTGFGLVVKNLTAADAGSYSVTLINAGGIVTSASATLTLVTAAAPVITVQPATITVTAGSTAVFSVGATGAPAPTYQWLRSSGQPGAGTPALIPGATGATLVLSGTTGNNAALAGTYSVVVTNSVNSVTSNNAQLAIATPRGIPADSNDPGRLTNLSVLTDISAAVPSFTVATVVGGGAPGVTKPLVVRADGPALGALGFPGTMSDPKLDLFAGPTLVGSNDNWGGSPALANAMASVGAFAFASPTSTDAAIFNPTLASGSYSVIVTGVGGSTGNVIAEIYDATPGPTYTLSTPRLINVSTLKQINAGGSLTLGFTIGGSTAKTVLIRAIGPGLAAVGLTTGTLADPRLTLFNSNSVSIATNDDWGADPQLSAAGGRVGAFAIGNTPSKDAMLLLTLPAGGYTATASGGGGTGGLAIVEVYEIP